MAKAPKRFKDDRKQRAYATAAELHDRLLTEQSAHGNAYRRGYLSDRSWPKDWISYPIFRAGRDRRNEEREQSS